MWFIASLSVFTWARVQPRASNCPAIQFSAGNFGAGGHDPPHALEEVTGTLDRAIGYSRALTYELSSPLLHQFGIEGALPWLVEQTGRRHGLQARCDCGEEPLGLSPEQGALLYRIAQELLRNVVSKHAAARRVTARLVPGADAVRLEFGDDGRGFRAAGPRSGATESGGFGLFSIRERLRDVGGTLRVETAPGRGTRVVLSAPLGGKDWKR